MDRIVLALLLLTATSSAWAAEWVQVSSSTGNGGYNIYADPATIRRSGDTVKMWDLLDFKSTQDIGRGRYRYLSSKSQDEYDCKDERTRQLYFTMHSGQMGGGEVVFTSDGTPTNWTPVAPGSIFETLWELACGKK